MIFFLLFVALILNLVRIIGLGFYGKDTKEYRVKIYEGSDWYMKRPKTFYVAESRTVTKWWKFSRAEEWYSYTERDTLEDAERLISKFKEADIEEHNKNNPTYKYYN